MAQDETDQPEAASGSVFTVAERIEQLSGIDKNLATLLESASSAVKALTSTTGPATLDSHKAAFSSATADYFRLLSSVDVGLRRQIQALEEADIIGAGKESAAEPATAGRGPQGERKAGDKTGPAAASGMGNLDVGWLNSRSEAVGAEMEAELWAKARRFLQDLGQDRGQKDGDGDVAIDGADRAEAMDDE